MGSHSGPPGQLGNELGLATPIDPDALWRRVRDRARREGRDLREVILGLLQQYAEGEAAPGLESGLYVKRGEEP